MATKLYVGGLPFEVENDQLKDFFSSAGTVQSAQVIIDRYTNKSKGFGFVEMSNDDEVKKAISELNGKELGGRTITVNEARPQEDRPRQAYSQPKKFNNNRRSRW